ncbi:MAG: ChbG/HpnK family deacetylase [Anaerolineae bacterium]|nr:ChbG/HpnK family deacetylase [Anaerolineae bacterium]
MKRLIVNADDLGRSPGVNHGILEAHRSGIVTSTTIMINLPDAPAGLERALAEAPDLGVGLHLNLTTGQPVSPLNTVTPLVDSAGRFFPIGQWGPLLDTREPGAVAEAFRREITAQVDRFIRLAGKPPDHMDAHNHAVYLHPAALHVTLDIAAQYNLPLRNMVFDGTPGDFVRVVQVFIPDRTEDTARQLVETLQGMMVAAAQSIQLPARFENGFYGQHATLGDLLLILTNLPDDSVTELMCHPGYVDDGLKTNSEYVTQREGELAHLTHAATLECVQSEEIELITFGDVSR